MPRKNKSIAKLVEEAAVLLQAIVRLKAADNNGCVKCVTCEEINPWNDGMDGGHFIPRKWLATRLLEENIHPQCKPCNAGFRSGDKGNLIAYTRYMEDTYGRDFVDHLKSLKHQTKKYYKAEILDLIAELKEQKKQLLDVL